MSPVAPALGGGFSTTEPPRSPDLQPRSYYFSASGLSPYPSVNTNPLNSAPSLLQGLLVRPSSGARNGAHADAALQPTSPSIPAPHPEGQHLLRLHRPPVSVSHGTGTHFWHLCPWLLLSPVPSQPLELSLSLLSSLWRAKALDSFLRISLLQRVGCVTPTPLSCLTQMVYPSACHPSALYEFVILILLNC